MAVGGRAAEGSRDPTVGRLRAGRAAARTVGLCSAAAVRCALC